MKQRQALVLGGGGFIGRHVARDLAERGYSVRALGHGVWPRAEWLPWGIHEWHTVDVTDEALAIYGGEPDLVVHCAGSGSVGYSMLHPRQDYDRTVSTTVAVLEFLRLQAPAARLVIPSSAGVYGLVQTMPIQVDAPLNPVSPYGVNKKIVEDLVRSYARHFGLNATIVRLFSIYGIGLRKQLLWDACAKLSRGETEFAGTGAETRDWLHVADAARLLVAAAETATPACWIVNGGTGVATANVEILRHLARHIAPGASVTFSGVTRDGDPQHYQADLATTAALDWAPARILADEVAAYADWYKRGAP